MPSEVCAFEIPFPKELNKGGLPDIRKTIAIYGPRMARQVNGEPFFIFRNTRFLRAFPGADARRNAGSFI
ncbi:protein of unknown function [Paraburkholderia kururiensis]